ncbi:hypothetical protein [Lacipirellula sp.]|uniref:hypothetical protein n=1 Tax=Lacipirellula sp. TaxID=2691419 RepID=UPI003D0D5051
MSSAPPSDNDKLLQYVERALRQNPLQESAAIIRRRNRLLGLEAAVTPKASGGSGSVDPGAQRQTLLKQIEKIRATFWTMKLDTLRESLAQLDAKEFPDVDAVVRRLTLVAKHRDQIPRILGQKDFDSDFFRVFKEVLIAAPRDSAIVKEKALVAFCERKLRKRGTRMIKLIERELPYFHQLESQWLKSLMAQRGRVSAPRSTQDHFEEGRSGSSFPWWGYIVIISLIRLVLSIASDK